MSIKNATGSDHHNLRKKDDLAALKWFIYEIKSYWTV